MGNPQFEDKFSKLDQETRDKILAMAGELGAWKTSIKWADAVSMHQMSLYQRIKKDLKKAGVENGKPQPKEEKGKVENKLTKEEKMFLDRLAQGSVSLEEASRVVAKKVFEKMLKNPGDVRFDNFFKTELLKIKQQENADKQNYMQTLLNRMFSGALPPRHCPQCGYEVIKIQEGEIVNAESVAATGDL